MTFRLMLLAAVWPFLLLPQQTIVAKHRGAPGGGGDPAFGSAVSVAVTTAGTQAITPAWTVAANSLLACAATSDEGGENNHITSITVSGSPTYGIAWAQLPTNGLARDVNTLNTEVWRARTTSGFTNQTVTVNMSGTERFTVVCGSWTGSNASTPIPASNKANFHNGAATVTVTSSSHDRSLYAGFLGCGDNVGLTVSPATGFTISANGSVNFAGVANQWVHGAMESKDAVVTPAANTAVAFTVAANYCEYAHLIAFEIAK
jgi:hypothetical protein